MLTVLLETLYNSCNLRDDVDDSRLIDCQLGLDADYIFGSILPIDQESRTCIGLGRVYNGKILFDLANIYYWYFFSPSSFYAESDLISAHADTPCYIQFIQKAKFL